MKKLTKQEVIKLIENKGSYCKVKIDAKNEITGMFCDEDYRYDKNTNTGGRRYIGRFDKQNDLDYLLAGCFED